MSQDATILPNGPDRPLLDRKDETPDEHIQAALAVGWRDGFRAAKTGCTEIIPDFLQEPYPDFGRRSDDYAAVAIGHYNLWSKTEHPEGVPANNRDAAMTPPILGSGAEPSSIPAQRTSLRAEAGTSADSSNSPDVDAKTIVSALTGRKMTIKELQEILDAPDGTYKVAILPNGEVRAVRCRYATLEPGDTPLYDSAGNLIGVMFTAEQANRSVTVTEMMVRNILDAIDDESDGESTRWERTYAALQRSIADATVQAERPEVAPEVIELVKAYESLAHSEFDGTSMLGQLLEPAVRARKALGLDG